MKKASGLFISLLFLLLATTVHAQVTCGSTCQTTAQMVQETTNYQNGVSGSKCLFIYNNNIYRPPSGTISGGMHQGEHSCGSDVTGIMRQSHLNNPNNYLVPYVCAPLCAASCQDADGDGFTAASCGGTDCNDNNANVKPGATETCNNIDDNCNAQVDENLQKQQSCGTGACAQSVQQTCNAGQYLPVCTPGQPTAEMCNSVDDNCNGIIDDGITCTCSPGQTRQQSCGIGACAQSVQQSCSSGAYSPACTPGQPIPEICNNNIDDDCDGATDNSCPQDGTTTPSNGTAGGITVPPPNVTQGRTCFPVCSEFCGQGNGCGGACPNTDINTPGKCGNPSCVPGCGNNACGQSNGCGGFCPATDKNSCGLCGNAPCCISYEICDDSKDNNCNGYTDEQCTVMDKTFAASTENLDKSVSAAMLSFTKMDVLARMAGLVAFFFAGLTLLIGIFRFELVKKFNKKGVIRYHAAVGSFALAFMILHIAAVLLDKGWSSTIKINHVFLPDFTGFTLLYAGLGSIGMYLLLLTITSGAFFIRISKKFGYKTWLFIHRASFLFYVFIFFHALNLGTDFQNPYVVVFFMHVIGIILLYVIYKLTKIKQINESLEALAYRLKLKGFVTVEEIASNPTLIGRTVMTRGTLTKVPGSEGWFVIYDQYSRIFAKLDFDAKQDTYSMIKGAIMKDDKQIYIQVISLTQ